MPDEDLIQVAPAPYVAVHLAAAITGYSEKAIRQKIAKGVWVEGREYVRAPDGRVLISVSGYAEWARGRKPSRARPARQT